MTTKRIPNEKVTVHTTSGIVYAGKCIFQGFLVGTDGVNDPEIAFYDNASAASGTKVVPTNTYDASLLGLNGVTGMHQYCENGLYVNISCAGTCEVIPLYIPYHYGEHLNWPADGQL
jgi:hypothetical protein